MPAVSLSLGSRSPPSFWWCFLACEMFRLPGSQRVQNKNRGKNKNKLNGTRFCSCFCSLCTTQDPGTPKAFWVTRHSSRGGGTQFDSPGGACYRPLQRVKPISHLSSLNPAFITLRLPAPVILAASCLRSGPLTGLLITRFRNSVKQLCLISVRYIISYGNIDQTLALE